MDSLIFSSVENIPGVSARAAFTVNSAAVFREEDWVETHQAHFFATTLFPNIDLCSLCGNNSGRWEKYIELRSRAVGIELTLAEDYFSSELMSELRLLNLLGSLSA